MSKRRPSAVSRKGRPHLSEPPATVMPDPKKVIWCPLCDWRNSDSFTGRRRLGNHIVEDHTEDVLFDQGVEPDDFE